jgi:transcription termination/antitermination protein NusG
MPFFVTQVQVGVETRLLGVAARSNPALRERLLWPRRRLRVRQDGRWSTSEAPIFTGYVFLRAEGVDEATYAELKRLPGFLRFLPSNTNIVPLGRNDTELLSHFLSFGEVVGPSIVYFDEQKRIRVSSGPLRGLEGRIVKVDRRKGRARVKLDLYDDSFLIDFGFQALEAAPEPAAR